MPIQDFRQCHRIRWYCLHPNRGFAPLHTRQQGHVRGRGQHRLQQIARCFSSGEYLFRQTDSENLLDAREQFDPPEAINAQIPFQ